MPHSASPAAPRFKGGVGILTLTLRHRTRELTGEVLAYVACLDGIQEVVYGLQMLLP